MRVISQDGSVNVPYGRTAFYQSAVNVWAVVAGHEFLIGSYDTPDKAKKALEIITLKGRSGYRICYVPRREAIILDNHGREAEEA